MPDMEDESGNAKPDSYFEQFAGPLGHVILEFNYLEVDVGRMIARLLNQDDITAAIFAATLPFIEKLKLAQSLVAVKVQDEDLKKEFQKIIKDATEINGKRNRYVHAEYWPVLGPKDELVKMLHRRLKDMGKTIDVNKEQNLADILQPLDQKDIEKLVEDISCLALRVRTVAEKFIDRMPG